MKNCLRLLLSLAMVLTLVVPAYAAITGTISGTVTDASGAVIPGVPVVVLNQLTGIKHTTVTDSKGFYSVPDLDIGLYTVSATMKGFESYSLTGVTIDANSAVQSDIKLKVGSQSSVVTVSANAVQVDTVTSTVGEVITSEKMTAVPLNGRSFTDLLALQPGVSPYSVETGGAPVPGGNSASSTGNVSINGGRGASNGYMVNGIDVNDGVENSAGVVPNLDSIEEFRIITSNFDAEYGNFSGGQVNVATKAGTNLFHGDAFEFLRNTVFNARGYSFATTAPARGSYNQSIYGGTVGGPIKKDKIFFFGDFQGTHQVIGTSDSANVPSAADLTGNVSDWATLLFYGTGSITNPPLHNTGYKGTVSGAGWAGVLSNRLGYTVTAGEPYFGDTNCTTSNLSDQCVFPNYVIPQAAWDPAAKPLMAYIPTANTSTSNSKFAGGLAPLFTTTAANNILNDYKYAGRVDFNTRYGDLFVYYFQDRDTVANPYGGGTDGQFPDATKARVQMANIGLTTTFKNNSVNSFRFGYVRSAEQIGTPTYATPGPSLASLGFVTPWGNTGGIGNISSGLIGVPQVSISEGGSFGTPTETQGRYVNTFQWLDNYTKVVGLHTYQFGVNYHYDQIDERNLYDVNGGFTFTDSNETGLGFADYLLGAVNGFTQASPQLLDSRSNYASGYIQDSWRVKNNLTVNYGLRYEISTPWYDTTNKLETIIPGEQSVVFPGAPKGWVFPGDRGVHRTLGPIHYDKFAPRFGFAYAPKQMDGIMGKIIGGDKLSIRGSVGFFYTNFQDESGFVEVGDAPYGLYYSASTQPMLSTPYVDRGTQNIEVPKFPAAYPPENVSATNPDNNVNWAALEPLSSSDAIGANNTSPYLEAYFLGIQRGFGRNTVLTVNYVGNQGRHLADSQEANPGISSLCLSLATTGGVYPSTPTCGPKGESNLYRNAAGTYIYGTRTLDQDNGEGLAFGANPYLNTNATSNYNSVQLTLKHSTKLWNALVGYTYGKSMDDASTLTDYANPFNAPLTYALSSYNVKQYLVASYTVHIPADRLTQKRAVKQVIGGWSVTGITKMAAGTPVAVSDSSDYSLCGCSGVDFPFYTPGNLFAGGANGSHNPRLFLNGSTTRAPYFNTALFTPEKTHDGTGNYGTPGNSMRRFFPGPGLDHTDLTIQRDFHIYHGQSANIRLEAFNVLNHAEFGAPSGSDTASTFGVVSSTQGTPRILQVAAKYVF